MSNPAACSSIFQNVEMAIAAAEAAAAAGDTCAGDRASWLHHSMAKRQEGVQRRHNREWSADDGEWIRGVLKQTKAELAKAAASRARKAARKAAWQAEREWREAKRMRHGDTLHEKPMNDDKAKQKRMEYEAARVRQVLEGIEARLRDEALERELQQMRDRRKAAEPEEELASPTSTVLDSSSSEELIPTIVIPD